MPANVGPNLVSRLIHQLLDVLRLSLGNVGCIDVTQTAGIDEPHGQHLFDRE